MDNLDSITESIRRELTARDEAREKLLPLCRDSIRYSANAIRAVHRREFELAEELQRSARSLLTEVVKAVEGYGELGNTGIIRDTEKEFAEANITLAVVTGEPLPTPQRLGVDNAAYLNGLGEAVGEIRRYLLDSMRQGDLSRGEELLSIMDDIYSVLVTMDFPDAITGGLRRTTDMVRGVMERTRSDLTLAMQQKALENKLAHIQPEGIIQAESQPEIVKKADSQMVGLPQEEPKEGQPEHENAETTRREGPDLDSIEMEIYEALTAWRNRKANEENLAPFIIAKNSWLKEIIKLRPSNFRELIAIRGFGERRVNKYGKEIIAIINKGR